MKRSRKRNIIIEGILVIFAFIAALLLLSAHWAFSNWSSLTVEEIYFQLTAPLAGTGNNMIAKYVLSAVVPAAVIAAGLIVVLFLLRKKNLQRKAYRRRLCLGRTGFYQLSCQPRQRLYLY